LLPVAHLSLGDVDEAVRALERTVKEGAVGGFVAPFTITKKPHGHPLTMTPYGPRLRN